MSNRKKNRRNKQSGRYDWITPGHRELQTPGMRFGETVRIPVNDYKQLIENSQTLNIIKQTYAKSRYYSDIHDLLRALYGEAEAEKAERKQVNNNEPQSE